MPSSTAKLCENQEDKHKLIPAWRWFAGENFRSIPRLYVYHRGKFSCGKWLGEIVIHSRSNTTLTVAFDCAVQIELDTERLCNAINIAAADWHDWGTILQIETRPFTPLAGEAFAS